MREKSNLKQGCFVLDYCVLCGVLEAEGFEKEI